MLRLLALVGVLPVLLNAASEQFIQDVVNRHNYWREKHGVPSVEADATINKYAQERADYLYETDTFDHPKNSPYGENIARRNPPGTGEQYVDQLYEEEAKFYLDNKYCGGEPDMEKFVKFGHYTQIVWKASTQIGVGKNGSFVVLNYSPSGNVPNQYAANVPCLTA